MFALNQDPPADEFVTSTELGRDIETSLTAMLSKLDSLEKTIGKSGKCCSKHYLPLFIIHVSSNTRTDIDVLTDFS